MIVTLQNDVLTVKIEDLGAQLASIQTAQGTEYLWQGKEGIWPRRAPLLFPVIGRLKDGCYNLGDDTYSIPTHGFARDLVFSITQQSQTSVTFTLSDTPETQTMYPFSFTLSITYTLDGATLTKFHKIENHSQTEMPFELGGHDGFCIPLTQGENPQDYTIQFPGVDTLAPYGFNEEIMITPSQTSFPLEQQAITVTPSTYGLDTVILDRPPQGKAVLLDSHGQPKLTMDCADFTYLAVWTAPPLTASHFVCIEPWTSLPDAVFAGRDLKEKAGVHLLAPGQEEFLSYQVTFHI